MDNVKIIEFGVISGHRTNIVDIPMAITMDHTMIYVDVRVTVTISIKAEHHYSSHRMEGMNEGKRSR